MTDEANLQKEPHKSRRMLWLWLGAFLFLGLVGAFCLLVLKPYLEVRKTIERWYGDQNEYLIIPHKAEIIRGLGGPRAAGRKLGLYTKLPNKIAEDKQFAVYLMGFCGSEAVPYLIRFLKNDDSSIREWAAVALGMTGDQRAVEPLIAAMCDAEEDVCFHAAHSLGSLGGDRAVEALIAVLNRHPDKSVRGFAASSLGLTHDRRAFEPLIVALGDSQPRLRRRASLGLSLLGDDRAIPALEALAARETNAEVLEDARQVVEMLRAAKAKAPAGKDEKAKPGGRSD